MAHEPDPSREATEARAGGDAFDAGTAGPVPLRLKFQSDPQHIGPARISIEKLCAAAGFEKAACEEVGLVVNEALANVIRHAYENKRDKPIELTARVGPMGLEFAIRDWGNGKHPLNAAREKGASTGAAKAPGTVEELKPGGLGLVCMRSLMDEVVFEPQPDGMLLRMRRRRRAATPRTGGGPANKGKS